MSLNEFNGQRSPTLIREYFELLRWKNKGCPLELSRELIESDERLLSIKQEQQSNETLISYTINSIKSVRTETLSAQEQIESVEKEIDSLIQSIFSLRESLLSLSSKKYTEEKFSSGDSSKIPDLSLRKIIIYLIKQVLVDIKQALLYVINYYLEKPIITAIILILVIPISLFLSWKFNIYSTIALLIIAWVYFSKKINYIYKMHQRTWKEHLAKVEIDRQQKSKQEFENRIQEERKTIEESLQEFEVRLQECRIDSQILRERKQTLEAYFLQEEQKLSELEQVRQQKLEEYQQKVDKLVLQEKCRKNEYLLNLEKQVQKWLDDDIKRLTNKGMKKLKIISYGNYDQVNVLQNEPIRVVIGITEKTKSFENILVDSDVNFFMEPSESKEIYIDQNDFESEKSFTGKSRKYGVYGFAVIFLCANFFSYYKCYYNFIRGRSVDEEIAEYMYDSIVSIKIQEKSSVRLKNEQQKNVYRKRLLITTNDGKIVCFNFSRNRVEKSYSIRFSQIEEAAIAIRDMLRKRRIDKTLTENLDLT